MDRRALLAGSAAGLWAASARAQQACFDRMDCFDTQLPGPSLDLQFTAGALDPRITFTRASVASYFDVAGTLQSAASGAPRFDYDPVTHAPRGLLIEEARTNLLLNNATLGTQSVTTAATPYTLSFYGTGTVTLTGTSTAGPLTGTGAFPARVSLTFTPTAGTLTLTVSGSVLNANLEAGSFATSAIVTAGASATRAADVATIVPGTWYNATAGTIACEFQCNQVPTAFTALAEFGIAGDSNNRWNLAFNSGSAAIQSQSIVGGATANFAPVGGYTNGVPYKAALALSVSASLVTAGGLAPNAAAGVTLAVPNLFAIGRYTFSSAGYLNGTIRRVRYWPRALGTNELQAVTR